MASRILLNRLRFVIKQKEYNCVHLTKSYRYITSLNHSHRLQVVSKYYINNNNKDFENEFDDIGDVEPLDLHKQRIGKDDNLKYLIIDVREPNELENSYNLGSNKNDWINIPKDMILNISNKEEFIELLNKKGINDLYDYQDLYFLCRRGVRSMVVAKHAVQFNLDQTLFNITGGITKYDQDVGLN